MRFKGRLPALGLFPVSRAASLCIPWIMVPPPLGLLSQQRSILLLPSHGLLSVSTLPLSFMTLVMAFRDPLDDPG